MGLRKFFVSGLACSCERRSEGFGLREGLERGKQKCVKRICEELYKSWPGDFSRILMSNSGNPNVIRVNETPFFAHSAKVGDVNGDSKLDVVSLNIGEPRGYDRTNIFLGNGNGRFDLLNAPNDSAVEWKSHTLRNNLNGFGALAQLLPISQRAVVETSIIS